MRRAEQGQGQRAGLTSDDREQLKALEREYKKIKRANEISKTASTFFVQPELDSVTAPALL